VGKGLDPWGVLHIFLCGGTDVLYLLISAHSSALEEEEEQGRGRTVPIKKSYLLARPPLQTNAQIHSALLTPCPHGTRKEKMREK